MTFAAPALLWSLLALAPLIAVYLLKVRPRTRPTTAYFLWEQVLTDRKPNRLWDRLQNLMSLLIMAAAFAAICLAMAQPRVGEATSDDLLIVIDNSLSMQAGQDGSTRLEIAKSRARDLARRMNGEQRAAVATLAGRLRYASYLSDNPRELLAAIDRVEPTHEPLRLDLLPEPNADDLSKKRDGPSAKVNENDNPAEASGETHPKRRVIFLTDGACGEPPNGVELLLVGGEAPNIGLVGADVRFALDEPSRLLFYYQVASTHSEPHEVDLLLYHEPEGEPRRLAKVIPLRVEPGENPPRLLYVDNAESGRWAAQLDGESLGIDSLEADNTAHLIAHREPPIHVRVAAVESYFFDRAVEAFSDLGGGLEAVADGGDIALSYRGVAGEAPRSILFAPQGDSPWCSDLGDEIEAAAPRVLVEKHPVVQNIDPLSIGFAGARRLAAPKGSEVLVESEAGVPLIYVAKRSGKSAIVVNLDPVAAEFYYSAGFPVLVQAGAKHLMGRTDPPAASYPPSSPVRLPGVTAGATVEIARDGSGPLEPTTSPSLPGPGFYTARSGERRWLLACSPLSVDESLLTPAIETAEETELVSGVRIDHWLVVAALVGVTLESVLYHRRKVG